jgi:hypothetical protein
MRIVAVLSLALVAFTLCLQETAVPADPAPAREPARCRRRPTP